MPFDLSRTEAAAYAACCLLVVLLGWRVLRSDEGHAQAVPAAGARTTATTDTSGGGGATVASAPPRDSSSIVHVVGAVHRAGVYRLRAGQRVQDAIARAGGATAHADLQAINLAAKVADGQQIVVPRKGRAVAAAPASGGGATAGGSAPSGPVNLNSATAEELDTLDGVGPATAQKILEFRQQHGGFSSVDDLSQIAGIGPKKLEALRAQVTV